MLTQGENDYSTFDNSENKHHQLFILQNRHKQLQTCLRERKSSLEMHLQILNEQHFSQSDQFARNSSLIGQMLSKQEDMVMRFSEKLLLSQVKIEEEAEMRGIIKSYELRVYELRSHLVDKECEISFQIFDRKKDSLARKQNMKIFHMEEIEKASIFKAEQELKRLTQETNKLENTLRQKIGETKLQWQGSFGLNPRLNPIRREIVVIKNDKMEVPHQFQGVNSLSKRLRESNSQKDKLVGKVTSILMEEIANANRLKKQHQSLQKDILKAQSKNSDLAKKYLKARDQRQRQILGNLLDLEQKIIWTYQRSKPNEQKPKSRQREKYAIIDDQYNQIEKNTAIFNVIDSNRIQQNLINKSSKNNGKRHARGHKNKQPMKQNDRVQVK